MDVYNNQANIKNNSISTKPNEVIYSLYFKRGLWIC